MTPSQESKLRDYGIAPVHQKDGKHCRHKGEEHDFQPVDDPFWKNVLKCSKCPIYVAVPEKLIKKI